MEKRNRGILNVGRRRLLILLFLTLSYSFPLFAVDAGIYVSSFEIPEGGTLVLEFTVLNTDPKDSSVELSGIPVSFTPSASKKERRMVKESTAANGQLPSTVIRQEWVATLAGRFSLGPFTITGGSEKVTLPAIEITITPAQRSELSGLRWILPDTLICSHRPVRIILEGLFSGKVLSITCPAPENALLEEVFRVKQDFSGTGEWVLIAAYNWTPLQNGIQGLPSAALVYEGSIGHERSLATVYREVSVVRDSSSEPKERVSSSLLRAFSPARESSKDSATLAVSGDDTQKLSSFPKEFANLSWKKGHYAEVLAALRHAEYTKLFPREFRASRLEAEASLDLKNSLIVPPSAWKPFAVIGAVICFTLAFLLKVNSRVPRVFRRVCLVLFFASAILAFFSIYVYTRDPGSAGVSRGGELFHVPEPDSTVIENIPEGTALVIERRVGEWLYVRSPSSMPGWVPASAIIEYTTE
jgi:hypothetical protein